MMRMCVRSVQERQFLCLLDAFQTLQFTCPKSNTECPRPCVHFRRLSENGYDVEKVWHFCFYNSMAAGFRQMGFKGEACQGCPLDCIDKSAERASGDRLAPLIFLAALGKGGNASGFLWSRSSSRTCIDTS